MKSSLSGVPQEPQPSLADETYLGGLRGSIELAEERLRELDARTAEIADLDATAAGRRAELSLLDERLDAASRALRAEEKMIETILARRKKAEADASERAAELELLDGKARDGSLRMARQAAELGSLQAEIRKTLESLDGARASKEVAEAALAAQIAREECRLADVTSRVAEQEAVLADRTAAVGASEARMAATAAALRQNEEAAAQVAARASECVRETERTCEGMMQDARNFVLEAKRDAARLHEGVEAAILEVGRQANEVEEKMEAADERLEKLEELKQNVLIELGKEIKNAALAQSNRLIQGYLKEIPEV